MVLLEKRTSVNIGIEPMTSRLTAEHSTTELIYLLSTKVKIVHIKRARFNLCFYHSFWALL